MPDILTKPTADALCTMILAGYLRMTSGSTRIEHAPMPRPADPQQVTATEAKAIADTLEEHGKYQDARSALERFGVTLNFGESATQETLPYIFAKKHGGPSIESASSLIADTWSYLRKINETAKHLQLQPKGAYIGGMLTTQKLCVVGPSSLDFYQPQFRVLDDSANALTQRYYDRFKEATNQSLTCLDKNNPALASLAVARRSRSVQPPDLHFEHLNAKINAVFQRGSLVKSYHGMIQVIVKFQSDVEKSALIFEIALGQGTTKVSSCFPCCTFMTANGTPPTSTHLDSGDFWNIPAGCTSQLRGSWEQLIIECYRSGRVALANADAVRTTLALLNRSVIDTQIPSVFLEALTFPGKFVDKVTATLGDTSSGSAAMSALYSSPMTFANNRFRK